MIFSDFTKANQVLPKSGRLLALDLGSKRIGLAVSDQSRFIATPKLILNRQSNQKDFVKIKNFIEENQVVGIIIGLPVNLDGTAIAMTEFAKKFAENFDKFLENKFPIFLFDERFSSSEARSFNVSELSRKNNKFIDDIAASLILQHFLDELSRV